MYNSGWDQYHSKEESVSHLEVFLLISADGTTDSETQADTTDEQQDTGSSDGTEGTSDASDGDATADQEQEDSGDEDSTEDESSDEEEGDDDGEEEGITAQNPLKIFHLSLFLMGLIESLGSPWP